MSGVREVFSEITERDIDVEVELGDDRVVRVVGKGTVAFQREFRPLQMFRDVYYVPGLKRNLISVSTIEDRGLEVLFRGGCVYILPKGASFASAKVIGTRIGKHIPFLKGKILRSLRWPKRRLLHRFLCILELELV